MICAECDNPAVGTYVLRAYARPTPLCIDHCPDSEERKNWRTRTDKWTRDVHGYAICPRCGAMIHQRMVHIHGNTCGRLADDVAPPHEPDVS